MMLYRGRDLDPVSLWEQFVDWPANADFSGEFAPLVRCPNPDHHTEKRHFQVNLEKPLVHCFTYCGIQGTYEHAISMIKGVTEREARKIILQHSRIAASRTSKRKIRRHGRGGFRHHDNSAEAPSLDFDTYLPQVALEYLAARGIGNSSIATFGIGWDAEERRIVIPADDERGITRFLIKRAVRAKDWPKYLYWPEGASKTAILFGACKLNRERVSSDGLVLCEGSFGAIRQQSYGVQATAILGTGLSSRQLHTIGSLRPPRIFFMFDPDPSGLANVRRAAEMLTKVPIFVCLSPRGKTGPDEWTKKEAMESIGNAMPLASFMRRLKDRGINMTSPKRRKEFANG